MTPVLTGLGWVTPLGSGVDEVWQRLAAGERAEAKPLMNPEIGRTHWHLPVPPKLVEALGRQPRLRRASPISYYTVGAAMAAWEMTGLPVETIKEGKVAVILAVSSGSVLYTRKFYEQVCKQGANSASPLLFPETVYNAPASHLAAHLGLDGITYTLVGDSSVGLSALHLARQLLGMGTVEHCLVVGAEEIDWVLCEGYRDWRIATAGATAELYAKPARGALLAEGGAAVVLSREGAGPRLRALHPGLSYGTRREARIALRCVTAELTDQAFIDGVIASANGSAMDAAEADALRDHLPDAPVCCPKAGLGEALGASSLLQVIGAAAALRTGVLPGAKEIGAGGPPGVLRETLEGKLRNVLVLSAGYNQQASGVVVTREE